MQEGDAPIRESREQRDAGRLKITHFRALLAEQAASTADNDTQRIRDVAARYDVDAAALGKVLKYASLVRLQEEDASL